MAVLYAVEKEGRGQPPDERSTPRPGPTTNEGFTEDYDLPNDTAYAETCASVALMFWAQRMLHLDLDGRYADVMEQALFNGALTGLARDGEHYFYSNPLESDGQHSRWAWHTCPCCTMNSSRLVASVGGYFVSHSEDAMAVPSLWRDLDVGQAHERQGGLRKISTYPWSGNIRIEVQPEAPTEFSLELRIPGWARRARASVNGKAVAVEAAIHNGYLTIARQWPPATSWRSTCRCRPSASMRIRPCGWMSAGTP